MVCSSTKRRWNGWAAHQVSSWASEGRSHMSWKVEYNSCGAVWCGWAGTALQESLSAESGLQFRAPLAQQSQQVKCAQISPILLQAMPFDAYWHVLGPWSGEMRSWWPSSDNGLAHKSVLAPQPSSTRRQNPSSGRFWFGVFLSGL